ncbi:MAG: N4-gp56 family major capsid protein [Atopobiaceae bacterium]|nr:N4-gp56 family major capsid protein [Atopobiaceae bacterium]
MPVSPNATLLTNLIDPPVFADLLDAKLIDKLAFDRVMTVDRTLVGQPGSTITIPAFNYIGMASDITEGNDIPIAQLTPATDSATIKMVGQAAEITDVAALSGLGDPIGEAAKQLGLSIADKINNDAAAILAGITGTMAHAKAGASIVADDVADALALFGEDIDGLKVLYVDPTLYADLRKSGSWLPASDVAADLYVRGVIGMVQGCFVVVSNRVTAGEAYIVKPGALRLYLKRDTNIEFARDILAKSTVISADKNYVVHLYDASKAIRIY